jgi:hypothetical protein
MTIHDRRSSFGVVWNRVVLVEHMVEKYVLRTVGRSLNSIKTQTKQMFVDGVEVLGSFNQIFYELKVALVHDVSG